MAKGRENHATQQGRIWATRTALLACDLLRQYEPEICGAAVYSASLYIRFRNGGFGGLRISDHPGRENLKYMWNIQLGGKDAIVDLPDGRQQYFAGERNARAFLLYIKQQFDTMEGLKCAFATTKQTR